MKIGSLLQAISREPFEERKAKIDALTKEDWIREHHYWIERISIRRWELECNEKKEKIGASTVAKIQARISDFLDSYSSFDNAELKALAKKDLIELVEGDISFAKTVFDEGINVVEFTQTEVMKDE